MTAGSVYISPIAITVCTGVLNSPTNPASPTDAVRRSWSLISVCAKIYSFQPWKNAMTAAAASVGATSGSTTPRTMSRREQPSMRAASSMSIGTPSIAPLRIHVMTGTVNALLARISPPNVLSSARLPKIAYSGTTSIASGSIWVMNSPKPTRPMPRKRNRERAYAGKMASARLTSVVPTATIALLRTQVVTDVPWNASRYTPISENFGSSRASDAKSSDDGVSEVTNIQYRGNAAAPSSARIASIRRTSPQDTERVIATTSP